MSFTPPPGKPRPSPHTWDRFKRAVRAADRDSLLLRAAGTSAAIARGDLTEAHRNLGVTPWTIADVARTALAWAHFQHPASNTELLVRLCNQNAQLVDEGLIGSPESTEGLGQLLARTYFEQFPSQSSVMAAVARTILLFGSAAEYPEHFSPKVMAPGWFEAISDGPTLDEYVEAVFLISVMTQQNGGSFSLAWLEGPAFDQLEDVISLDVVRQVFTEYLVTTVPKFKEINRGFQEKLPPAQRKFAFNPLTDKPFIEGVAPVPIAPWVQAVIRKASPPAIYHFGFRELGPGFTDDLGPVFQHYVGRQLSLIEGDAQLIAEFKYGPTRERKDSCDWFLDLPGLLVLVECKARQPIESLRIGGADWMKSVQGSIGHAIRQINQSSDSIQSICAEDPRIDASKPRVGLIVTLEPFYVTQNWILSEQLPTSKLSVAVLSVGELEHLAVLSTVDLEHVLIEAAGTAQNGLMRLAPEQVASDGPDNALLATTWDSIDLFARVEAVKARMQAGNT